MVTHIKEKSGLDLYKTTAAKYKNMKKMGIKGVGGQMASLVAGKKEIRQKLSGEVVRKGRKENRDASCFK